MSGCGTQNPGENKTKQDVLYLAHEVIERITNNTNHSIQVRREYFIKELKQRLPFAKGGRIE